MDDWKNKLYYGDNLDIMREHIADESVDLIYLDPPFNSKATYNVLFKEKNGTNSAAQITAFDDTWHWDINSEKAYREIVGAGSSKLAALIQALRSFLGTNDMMAYLTMMAIRLVEMHRVLKQTGSIYLHCDPTASHYLKLVLDAIFGFRNFKNEIIWRYRRWPAKQRHFQRMHDIIFRYTKSKDWLWSQLYEELSESSRKQWKGKLRVDIKNIDGKRHSETLDQKSPGVPMCDVWEISQLSAPWKEYLGYPTQKPEALLERIIKASSNEGDIVLDPFCGCGTTVAVAEKLHRKWIGIDITHLAITLMKHRLEDSYGKELSPYEIIGDPKDLQSARTLAEQNRYQFEWWALSLVGARPAQDKKKGADKGTDGYLYFFDDESGQAKKIVVQVKSGHISLPQIRDLAYVIEREQAAIGIFITLQEPTGPMKSEAASAGFYETEIEVSKRKMSYPRIQIVTIEELLGGIEIKYPEWSLDATHKKAERKKKSWGGEQILLL